MNWVLPFPRRVHLVDSDETIDYRGKVHWMSAEEAYFAIADRVLRSDEVQRVRAEKAFDRILWKLAHNKPMDPPIVERVKGFPVRSDGQHRVVAAYDLEIEVPLVVVEVAV